VPRRRHRRLRLRNRVFVERSAGVFEPREVTTAAGSVTASRSSTGSRLESASSSPARSSWIRTAGWVSDDQPHHRPVGEAPRRGRPARARRRARGLVVAPARPARRAAGSRRHPGDRLLDMGSQPGPGRGPGHLSDRDGAARRAQGESRARRLRFRRLVRLRRLRRTAPISTGPARARWNTCRRRCRLPAGRQDRARSGRDRARLDLSVRARRRLAHPQPGRPAVGAGLVPAVSLEIRAWGGRRGVSGRLRAPVPGERRSESAAGRTDCRSAASSTPCAGAMATSAAG
jgi:hypothetical protein